MLIVHNSYLEKLLATKGYFTTPFLDEEQVAQLQTIYQDYFSNTDVPFYATSFHPDLELKYKANAAVLEVVQQQVENLFSDFKILGTSFLEKLPNQNNPLPIHQDWTVTDEQKHGSFTIWIPLQATNEQNGAIRVIAGSHNIESNLRAPSLPVTFEKNRAKLERYLETLPMQAGEAFVFQQSLMHASWPNATNSARLALTIGLAPKDAELFMLYNDKGKVSKYAMPDDMFLRYPEIIEQPKIGTFVESFAYHVQDFSESDLKEGIYQNRVKSNLMQPLFKAEKHQQDFEQNGYIKVPALDQSDIDKLINLLEEQAFDRENGYGFYVGMDHKDKAAVSEMMDRIAAVALPKVAPYLQPHQLITASFVIKDPNPRGVVPPHQDWTFVEDEEQHCSVTCWIPLVDTTMENGCMGVIKGSNNYFSSVRPSPSPQSPSPLAKHMFTIFPYMQLLPMKAGEALIFDNRTMHASPPNTTDGPRLAVGLSFTQKEAELRHYYLKPGTKDTLIKYKIDPSFFKKYDNASLSKMYDSGQLIEGYEKLGEVQFLWDDLTKDEFKNRMEATGNTYNSELTKQMAALFASNMKNGLVDKVKSVISMLNPINLARKIKSKVS